MIEFTISRVVLCVCGVALLALAMSAVGTTEDRIGSDLDEEAAQEIADILDRFEESVLTSLTLEAADVLPSAEHTLTVRETSSCWSAGTGAPSPTPNATLRFTWTGRRAG